MSYTERFKVLGIVHEAKIGVKKARFDTELTPAQNSMLEKLFVDLDQLESDLILGILDERIEALKRTRRKLMRITKKIEKDIEKLAKIAELVGKAAKSLKFLLEIVSASSSLRLI